MKNFLLCLMFSLSFIFSVDIAKADEERRFNIEVPSVNIKGVKSKDIKIYAEIKKDKTWELDSNFNEKVFISGIENISEIEIKNGEVVLSKTIITEDKISIKDSKGTNSSQDVFFISGFFSLLPPIIAIILAFFTHNVLVSIFSGILTGLIFIYQYNPLAALIHFFDKYMLETLLDKSHVSIILFCLALGGIIRLISNSGGVEGIVGIVTKYANSRKKGQFATWFMGLLIFFDDYASALLVGNTMRPYTDSLKISREKLSYLVDVMAAPVSCMAIISTWIGFQLGQIETAMQGTNIKNFSAYDIFFSSLPYNFYCIFAIIFSLMIVLTGRDFGLMYKAEKRAVEEGKLYSDKASAMIESSSEKYPPKPLNAIIPILSIILVTGYGILYTGINNLGINFSDISFSNLREIMAASSTSKVLLWSGIIGIVLSIFTITFSKVMSFNKAVDTWVSGASSMLFAVMILCQAWTLASVCSDLNTNAYLINLIGSSIPLWILPSIVFLVSSVISFATGTSYGTMGILFPLVTPLAVSLLNNAHLDVIIGSGYNPIFLGVIGAVFAGALFGDHCSPISDTTTMSALSTGSDLIDHFSSQLIYGLVVLAISVLSGFLLIGFGINPLIAIFIGIIVMFMIIKLFGKKVA